MQNSLYYKTMLWASNS